MTEFYYSMCWLGIFLGYELSFDFEITQVLKYNLTFTQYKIIILINSLILNQFAWSSITKK